MTDRLTRTELLRRGAAGGAPLAVPGAACGGARRGALAGDDPRQAARKTLTLLELAALHRRQREDEEAPDARRVHRRSTGVKVKYIEDINDNATFFGKIQGPLSRGQSIGRDIIVMTDNSPYPALLVEKGWVEKLDKSVDPEHQEPRRTRSSTRAGTRTASTACPGSPGMTGIGYNAKLTKPVTTDRPAPHRSQAEGQGHAAHRDGRHGRRSSCSRTATTPARSPTPRSTARSRRSRRRVKSGQIRQFTGNDYAPLARQGRHLGGARLVGRHRAAAGRQQEPQVRRCPKSGGMIWTDNMLIPKGGNAYTASVFMNFVYDPKIAARDRGLRQLHLPGEGRRQGARSRPTRSVAKNPLIFPPKSDAREAARTSTRRRSSTPDYKEKWQKPARRLMRHVVDIPPPAPLADAVPAARAGAGLAGACSSSSRSGSSATSRSSRGTIDFGYAFTWAWHNYSRRDLDVSRPARSARSSTRGSRPWSALLLSYPLAYWIAFRGGRWKNLLPALHHRPRSSSRT